MARQRFIWPQMWDDPDLGNLDDGSRLLYIGCFSLADDDGRLVGDPVYLKTQVFRYRPTTVAQVGKMRDRVNAACSNFIVYEHAHLEYIAFRNWSEYQKPKYPKPSRLPAPPFARKRRKPASTSHKNSGNDSPGIPGTIPQEFPRNSPMGWVGLGYIEPSFLPTSTTDGKEGGTENGEYEPPQLDAILRSIP